MARVNAAGARFATVGAITCATAGVERWLDDAIVPFVMLVSILSHVVSPEKVVIGGRVPPDIATELAARITPPRAPMRNDTPFPLPTVVASDTIGDTVAFGAGLLPFLGTFFSSAGRALSRQRRVTFCRKVQIGGAIFQEPSAYLPGCSWRARDENDGHSDHWEILVSRAV